MSDVLQDVEPSNQHFVTLTGAHGVGKTTLIDAVVRELSHNHDITVVKEPAREIAKEGFYVNDKITLDGVYEYLSYCLAEARQAATSLVLTDRSIFDLYVYTRDQFGGKFSRSLEKLIVQQILAERKRTKLWVYVPIEFEMEEDDIRPTDIDYQHHIDGVVCELIRHFELPNFTVSGSLEERTMRLSKRIQEVTIKKR